MKFSYFKKFLNNYNKKILTKRIVKKENKTFALRAIGKFGSFFFFQGLGNFKNIFYLKEFKLATSNVTTETGITLSGFLRIIISLVTLKFEVL